MPVATLLGMPRAVFYDANGNPLAAGLVHTYVPGGTTPAATWQDAGETIPNANPIILDAAGSCSLYGTGSYQLTVTDYLGNAIPAYSGVTSNTDANFVSVKDFGATGNGTTDDTVAFQNALKTANPGYGMCLYVPSGFYLISSTITLSIPNVAILGEGIYTTNFVLAAHTFNVFNVTAPDVTLSDFTVTSGIPATGSTPYYVVQDATSGAAYNLRMERIAMNAVQSGALTESATFNMLECRMFNIAPVYGVGVTVSGLASTRDLVHCYFQNSDAAHNARAGVLILQGSTVSLLHCEFVKMGNPVWVAPISGAVFYSLKMLGSWCDTSTGVGILLDGSLGPIERANISSGWISSCLGGVRTLGAVNGLSIEDCEIYANSSDGIYLNTTTSSGTLIAGNRIAGNGGNGVNVAAPVSNFSIVNNAIGPFADFGANGNGIVVQAGGSDGFLIVGNRLRGNTVASLTNGGTGGSTMVASNLV